MSGPFYKSPAFLTRFSEEEKSLLAHAKRFRERYIGDPSFRELVAIDSREAAKKYNIDIDPEEIRPIWDPSWNVGSGTEHPPLSQLAKLCFECDREINSWNNRHKVELGFRDVRFRAWWQRQLARCDSEFGAVKNSGLVHAPACFELSDGCTVGCWFCAISADKFAGAFAYTPENARLWKDVLEVVYGFAGTMAQAGFCYWATDPLDNPDYERFIADYREIIGALPGTNTAKPHKDLARVRSILKMWKDRGGFTSNHLSVLTVKILDQIFEEFTPEDLLWTGLNLVNKQSLVPKARAGRARDRMLKLRSDSDEYHELVAEFSPGTIACVSGFLFNMVKKTVKLITPCQATDRWPKGYKILDEGAFTDGVDLRILLEGMVDRHMPLSVPEDQVVRLRNDLKFRLLHNGFEIPSAHQRHQFVHPVFGKALGERLRKASMTAQEIVESISKKPVVQAEVRDAINAMFNGGVLED